MCVCVKAAKNMMNTLISVMKRYDVSTTGTKHITAKIYGAKMNRRGISQRHAWSPFDTWRGERQSEQRAETEIEVTGVPITAVTSVSRRARDLPTVSTQTLIDREPV